MRFIGVWAVEAVEQGTGLRRQWAASFTSSGVLSPSQGAGPLGFQRSSYLSPAHSLSVEVASKEHIETFLGETSTSKGKAECWEWGPFILVWKKPGNSSVAIGINKEQGQPLRLQASLSPFSTNILTTLLRDLWPKSVYTQNAWSLPCRGRKIISPLPS